MRIETKAKSFKQLSEYAWLLASQNIEHQVKIREVVDFAEWEIIQKDGDEASVVERSIAEIDRIVLGLI